MSRVLRARIAVLTEPLHHRIRRKTKGMGVGVMFTRLGAQVMEVVRMDVDRTVTVIDQTTRRGKRKRA